MRMTYELKKGSYYVGDPATIVLKNKHGEAFLEELWKKFYKSPNEFQQLKIKGCQFLVTRTEGGDGIFNGVGTDTGVIMISDLKELENEDMFRQVDGKRNTKVLTYDHDTSVSVENFNIYFEDFTIETV